MKIELHHGDLPDGLTLAKSVAVDTETAGLNLWRDRLYMVQLTAGDGTVHLVKFDGHDYSAPRLKSLFADPDVLKIFHFARFDVAVLQNNLGVATGPIYCTKIASKLSRTYTDRHGLKDLCRDLLGVDLSKQQQMSDWGASKLSREQLKYAASDVLYLHDLKARLDEMLARDQRRPLAQACFDFIPTRVALDLGGWPDTDIFEH